MIFKINLKEIQTMIARYFCNNQHRDYSIFNESKFYNVELCTASILYLSARQPSLVEFCVVLLQFWRYLGFMYQVHSYDYIL